MRSLVKLNEEEQKPCCEICVYSEDLPGLTEMTCKKKGIVARDFCCRKFELNILAKTYKRKHSLNKDKISKMDFSI